MLALLMAGPLEARPDPFSPVVKVIHKELLRQNVHGAAVVILHRGQVALIRGFGVADRESRAAVTPRTLFRIGSTTKLLTTIAALRMAENGQLDLDQLVTGYLSEFRIPGAITTRHLLSHTAGLADRIALYGPTDPNALRDYVAGLHKELVLASPGQVFSYSNLGFNVAGRALEQVGGRPYSQQIADLTGVLGMPNTTFTVTPAVAQGYQDGQPVRPIPDNGAQYPSGFALAPVLDMTRLLEFLLRDGRVGKVQVLSATRTREMKTAVLGVPPFNQAYGLGVWIGQRRGLPTFGHGGNVDGYTSFLETVPSQQLGVAILCNQGGFSSDAIMEATLDALKVPRSPAPPIPPALNPTDYQGLYEWLSPTDSSVDIYRVYAAGDGLHLNLASGDFPLQPLSTDGFRATNGAPVAFLRDTSGAVNFLSVLQAAPRLPRAARDVNVALNVTDAELDAASIERAVVQPASRAHNDLAAARAAQNPQRLLAFGTVNLLESGAFDEIRRCLGPLGLVGLRVSLRESGLDLRNPDHLKRLQTAFELVQEKALPILIELADVQGRTLDEPTLRLFVDQVAALYPDVRLAVSHAGGTGLDPAADLTATRNLVQAYRDHPTAWKNAYLELSHTTPGPPLVEALRLWGWPRVLLGGGDVQSLLRLPVRRAERLALLGNDGAAWLGR